MSTQIGGPGAVVALPKAGAGVSESTSVNFLLIGSLLTLFYVAGVWMVRLIAGRGPELEDDGIQGI